MRIKAKQPISSSYSTDLCITWNDPSLAGTTIYPLQILQINYAVKDLNSNCIMTAKLSKRTTTQSDNARFRCNINTAPEPLPSVINITNHDKNGQLIRSTACLSSGKKFCTRLQENEEHSKYNNGIESITYLPPGSFSSGSSKSGCDCFREDFREGFRECFRGGGLESFREGFGI